MQQIASQNAPSSGIVIPHFIIGGLTWLIVTVLIIFSPNAFTQHYFNPKLLAITHLLVLGWITMIIFGALYQLIPVIMGVKLYSEKLALISMVLLATGSFLLALSFWNFWLGITMHLAATLVILSVTLFAFNVFITTRKSSNKSIEKEFIQTSVIWLLFTIMAGLSLAINLTHPFLSTPHLELLKIHAHTGIVGWFIQLIIGVGSKLFPMFLVSHNLKTYKLKISYYLINLGLIIGMISSFLQIHGGVVSSIVAIALGIIFFLSFLYEVYSKRVKKHLDIGMKQSALSFITLTIPLILMLIFSFNDIIFKPLTLSIAIAYGSCFIIGFVSSLIMGQTYKTLPFIVWMKIYRKHIGKAKTPFPKDLFIEKIAIAQLWTFAIGFTILLTGTLLLNTLFISIGGFVLFISVTLYNFNILKIVLHKPEFENG